MEISDKIHRNIEGWEAICVLTGAGISAESGVPTFRSGGQSAVWKGMPFDQISSARMVKEDLGEVWEWFDYRRTVLGKCEPNLAHKTLVGWESRFKDFTLVTQNVDGLHTRAGSDNVIEVHGNINRSRCLGCGKRFQMAADDVPHKPTECDECGQGVRPDVILFGEMLPPGAYENASIQAESCDIFLVIGTSALVYPAAMLPEVAKRNGAYLVEVNPEETPLTSHCDESFRGKAGDILPNLL